MGKYTRKNRVKRRRRWRDRISADVFPLYEKVQKALFNLKQEKQILSYQCKGQVLNAKAVFFEFYFLFWSKKITIYVYQTEKKNQSDLIVTTDTHFDLLTGVASISEDVQQEIKLRAEIANAGGIFERNLIERVQEFLAQSDSKYRAYKSGQDADEEGKIDLFIESGVQKVGIQVKTDKVFWKKHIKKHTNIPSLLFKDKNIEASVAAAALIFVFKRKLAGDPVHINVQDYFVKEKKASQV